MKLVYYLFPLALVLAGCAKPAPPLQLQWDSITKSAEMEYQPYLEAGNATIIGQAFLIQRGGDVVKAAGRTVTLDPATSIGNEWWEKVGSVTERYETTRTAWSNRYATPPSTAFAQARRTTIADADGRFKFSDLPAGKYYIRTEVTWEVTISRYTTSTEGGLIGQLVEVQAGQTKEVILTR